MAATSLPMIAVAADAPTAADASTQGDVPAPGATSSPSPQQTGVRLNSALSYTTSDGSLTTGIRGDNLANKRYDQRTTYIPTGSGEYPNYARAYNNPRMVNVFINKTF